MAASITDTQGIIAIAAAALAGLALLGCLGLALSMRRMRRAQRVVMGEEGQRDLVAHAARIEEAFAELREYVDETARRLEERLAGVENALRGTFSHRALVRYDAYNELSGHQSSSLALLDSHRSGVVLSSIVHRDQARLYVKQIIHGEAEIELSPEEREAVESALAPARQAA